MREARCKAIANGIDGEGKNDRDLRPGLLKVTHCLCRSRKEDIDIQPS